MALKIYTIIKARSHGAMGCVDVNDAVHMVRLQYIFVCNVRHHI